MDLLNVLPGGSQASVIHLFHGFEKGLDIHLRHTITVTQPKRNVDWACLNIPDLVVMEVVAPFVKVKRLDRMPIISVHAFDDGEEFAHGICIVFGIALWDDQPFPFHLITNC